MRRFWFIFLLVVLVVLIAMASRAYGQAPFYERAAAQVWPGSQCEGRVVIVRSTLDELEAMTHVPLTSGAAFVGNPDGTCRVWIRDDVLDGSPYVMCTVYVHEYGHLAGHDHGEPLMGDNGDHWQPCIDPHTLQITAKQGENVLLNRLRDYKVNCVMDGDAIGCMARKRLPNGRVDRRKYRLLLKTDGSGLAIVRVS